jgi:hypothetical protein
MSTKSQAFVQIRLTMHDAHTVRVYKSPAFKLPVPRRKSRPGTRCRPCDGIFPLGATPFFRKIPTGA